MPGPVLNPEIILDATVQVVTVPGGGVKHIYNAKLKFAPGPSRIGIVVAEPDIDKSTGKQKVNQAGPVFLPPIADNTCLATTKPPVSSIDPAGGWVTCERSYSGLNDDPQGWIQVTITYPNPATKNSGWIKPTRIR